ncbi:hypothetical protein LCI18_000183 [Fusarium solani-melongenae]|uniref:Uncharacterized protein n=1 Tax=Fusarium solani subsp. cucurbitae TaxID=2747967 RepID=A0ACD3YK85_FUSSC|nr:hypothetical protein LCI18_000183 [Fusarium solani-melongenae]
MNLTEFSAEILLQICEEFCQHCQEKHMKIARPDWWRRDSSRRALLDLSFVNRKVGYIAQRVLHHHFGYVDKDREPNGLARFFRTISNNPGLGKCLRWANLSMPLAEIDRDVIQGWLLGALEKFSHHVALNAQMAYEECPNFALSPLIVLQAPNLERIDDDGKIEGPCLFYLDGSVVRDGALPQNLSTVWLGDWIPSLGDHDRLGQKLSLWGLGYQLSSLPKLHALGIYCPVFSIPDERVLFQHLRVLRLGDFLMRRDELERLISCTPMLEEFAHFYFGLPAMDRGATATVPDICEVLTLRKDTLRRVMLDASCTTDDIHALRELDNLEELKIWAGPSLEAQSESYRLDSHALVRALPPSLQKLHVISVPKGLASAGEALMTYIRSTYRESSEQQKLKKVYFDVYEETALGYSHFKKLFELECQEWTRHGTVVISVRRFAWYDMGDWGSGEGNVEDEDCSTTFVIGRNEK